MSEIAIVALYAAAGGVMLICAASSFSIRIFAQRYRPGTDSRVYLLIGALGLLEVVLFGTGAVIELRRSRELVDAALFVRSIAFGLSTIFVILVVGALSPGRRSAPLVIAVAILTAVRTALWFPTDLVVRHPVHLGGWPSSGPLGWSGFLFVVALAAAAAPAIRHGDREVRIMLSLLSVGTAALVWWALVRRHSDEFERIVTVIGVPIGLSLLYLVIRRLYDTAKAREVLIRRQVALVRLSQAALVSDDVDAVREDAQQCLRREFRSDAVLVLVHDGPAPEIEPDDQTVVVRGRSVTVESRLPRTLTDRSRGFCESVLRVVATMVERSSADAEAAHGATHDAQTALPNQALFLDRLAGRLATADGTDVVVVLCQVVGFARIGAVRGSTAMSSAARKVANTIAELVDADATVARLATDEFGVIEQVPRHDPAGFLAHRLRHLESGLEDRLRGLGLRVVVGAAAARDGSSAESLLRDGRTALDRAVERGRTEIFNDDLRARLEHRVDLERALQHAVERDEIEVRYQPIVAAGTGSLVGYEALSRWRRGVDIVAPAAWIPVAETTGLISLVGSHVLEIAGRDQAELDVTVSVNVSPLQLAHPEFLRTVRRMLETTGVDPRCVVLEVTETAVMADLEHSVRVLDALRATGLRVALDDFGTSYSSLSALVELPVDALKIDQSFVRRSDTTSGRSVIAAIVTLAGTLGASVVAEGVETEQQLAVVTDLGVDRVQGFLIGRPVTLDRIRSGRSRPRPRVPAG